MNANCRPHHPRRLAFTAIELLVLMAIVLVLLAIFVPYLLRTREISHRTQCADHLRAIGIALNTYAGKHDGRYPSVPHDRTRRPRGYVAFSGADSAEPFAPGSAVQGNDVTASLWLLVRDGDIDDLSVFICPSTSDYADVLTDAAGRAVGAGQRSNFRGGRNLSYSYCSPFSDAPGFRLDDLQNSALAVMADKNPGRSGRSNAAGPSRYGSAFELAAANSLNHGRAGQNVLYRNGEVRFWWTPYCGLGQDNVYTAMAPEPLAVGSNPVIDANGVVGPQYGPAWVTDSYLVPTAQENSFADFPKAPASAATAATSQAATHPLTTTTTQATPTAPTQPASTQTTQPATTETTRPATTQSTTVP